MVYKQYIRDGRAPIPKKELTSRIMSSIRAKNTKIELLFRKELFARGVRGYRLHWNKAPGRPDICFTKKKIAVFINGCYWHRCPHCKPSMPKTHQIFWREKFLKNQQRDKKKGLELRKSGWGTLVFWECRLKKDMSHAINDVTFLLKRA